MQVNVAALVGLLDLVEVAEDPALALGPVDHQRQVVGAEDHVLGGNGDRATGGRRQDVVRRQHETRASAWASADSGRWTAIWSPSKSALNAVQTSGWIWIALPSTSTGSKAWMPRRWSVGARFKKHRVLLDDLSSTSQTWGGAARPCAWRT